MRFPCRLVRAWTRCAISRSGCGALEATLDLARDYAEAAKASLGSFPTGEWRGALEDLADFAVSRRA